MNAAEVATIILPVFALMGLGYGAAWTGLLSDHVGDGLAKFVFVIAVPALMFKSIATANFSAVSPWRFLASYFVAVALTWLIADRSVRHFFGRDGQAGIIAGVSAGYSNLVLLGIPFVFSAFGQAGAAPLFLLISVHLPIMMTVSVILFTRTEEQAEPQHRAALLARILRTLLRNPMIIAILAALLWRLGGFDITKIGHGIINTTLDKMALAAVPCALFSLGMGLRAYGIRGHVTPALILCVLKMLAMPAIVYLIATHIAGLPPLWVTVATLGAACPTGVNAWLLANHFNTGQALAANSITITTGLAVVTMTGWLIFLQSG